MNTVRGKLAALTELKTGWFCHALSLVGP